jgi:hypothetical protein
MPKRKPFKFGGKAKHAPVALRECDECGAVMRSNSEGILVCGTCNPSQGRRQDEQADGDRYATREFSDVYLDYFTRDSE